MATTICYLKYLANFAPPLVEILGHSLEKDKNKIQWAYQSVTSNLIHLGLFLNQETAVDFHDKWPQLIFVLNFTYIRIHVYMYILSSQTFLKN